MHFINVQINKLIFLNIQDISLKIDSSNPPGWMIKSTTADGLFYRIREESG